jgi:hypothetical protein
MEVQHAVGLELHEYRKHKRERDVHTHFHICLIFLTWKSFLVWCDLRASVGYD